MSAVTPRRSARRAWASWALLAVAAAGLALAVPATAQEDGAAAEQVEGDANVGANLYAQYCAQCHGANGEGVTAPPVTDVSPAYVELTLRTQRMPPGDPDGRSRGAVAFDEEQQAGLVAFMTERWDLEGEVDEVGEGDAARGREIFATNCAACHGSTGAGGIVGGGAGGGGVGAGGGSITPNLVGLDPRIVALATRVGPFQMPRFSSEQIDDQGVSDVAAFLEEVEHEPTTLLGFAELNPVFASGFVFFLALAVLVSCMWIGGRVQMFPTRDANAPTADDMAEHDRGSDL